MNCTSCHNLLNEAQYAILNGIVYKSCPQCSSNNSNEHIFYVCPEKFGQTAKRVTSNNPLGLQSHCAKCRSNKIGPHAGALSCSTLKESGGHIIKEIRLLPMSSEMFPTLEDVQFFLTNTMPERDYTYFYSQRKLNCAEGTLILFQYQAKLLGYAIHLKTEVFETPVTLADGREYHGKYYFAPNSLIVFDDPIVAEEFAEIDSTFTSFSQATKRVVPGLLPAIISLADEKGSLEISNPDSTFLPEEISSPDRVLKEGVKKQIVVNAYERNSAARGKCLNHYRRIHNGKLICEICGFDFASVYGEQFSDKIHVHHLVEISSIGEEYEIDAVNDLLPVCPNCHMIAHSKKPAYTPEEIRTMMNH